MRHAARADIRTDLACRRLDQKSKNVVTEQLLSISAR